MPDAHEQQAAKTAKPAFTLNFGGQDLLALGEGEGEFPHLLQRGVLPILVTDSEGSQPLGTGFLISAGLLVTAWHVIADHVDRAERGEAAFSTLYITEEDYPGRVGNDPWGGPFPVTHIAHSTDPSMHDLALLSLNWPSIGGEPLQPIIFDLSFEPPEVGTQVLVLGYSDMAGGTYNVDPPTGTVSVEHSQRLRASDGQVQELHPDGRDSLMVTFPAFRGNYESPHGMSGGPVVSGATGKVVAVVCTSFDHAEGDDAISYASLTAPLLGLGFDYSSDPEQANVKTLWDFLEEGRLTSDGTHRLHERPPT